MTITAVLGWFLLALAVAAIGYTVHATLAVIAFARASLPVAAAPEPVTLLKPLHGAEPRLGENLATFLAQDWAAPIELVAGVADPRDPAFEALATLPQGPWRAVTPVIDPTRHGANAKIGNLINMAPAASHDLIILSDSDMAVPPDYCARIAAALAQPGIGAVTCLYHGRGDAGRWSRFAAAAIGWQFAPSVVTSYSLGIEQACMGSTIALRRATLDRIGGFAAFADTLADDHAIGMAVRALGLRVVPAPRLILAHGCAETSAGAVWRHERRWAATVRGADLAAHLGSALTHPLVLALLSVPLMPRAGACAVAAALLARVALARSVDRWVGSAPAPLWWLPARDLFSFAVFVASFAARSVDWRGQALRMGPNGRIAARKPR